MLNKNTLSDFCHRFITSTEELSVRLQNEKRFIFFIAFCLTLFGMLMIYEASSLYAYNLKLGAAYFFKRQFLFFLAGLFFFFFATVLDWRLLRRFNREFLIVILLVLGLLLFIGQEAGGAKRWFNFFALNFQPSELLKVFFLFYAADYLQRKKEILNNFSKGLLPLLGVLGAIILLLILQPDLGAAIFWIIWIFIFLFLHRVKKKYLFFIALFGLIISLVLIKAYPSRLQRITAYLNPFADPKGSGFQIIQSQIAYGEGGIFGVGLGEGKQKLFFLPAAHTDFIFSIVAEEFGLLGSLGILSLFVILFHKMLRIVKINEDATAQGILLGIVLIFFLEIVINIGVSCGLFPTKGLPLPFMSYGGSSLIVHYILLGLFFNLSRKENDASTFGL